MKPFNDITLTLIHKSVVFSGSPVSSTNKTDHRNIIEILLKGALNTIKQTNKKRKTDEDKNILAEM